MTRLWKVLGIAAGVMALAGGALVVFAPVGGFKTPLEAEVTAVTGRAFRIDGPISLTLTPEFALDLGAVTLGDGEGEGPQAAPLATARRAVLAVRFLPLLSGEAEGSSLTLEGAAIAFAPGGEGWRFVGRDGVALTTPFDALPFGDVRLIDSQIRIGDIEIAAPDVRLRWSAKGQSLSISGQVGLRGQVFVIDAVLERRDALMAGGRVPMRVEFESALAHGSIDGVADLTQLAFEGGVSISASSTRALAGFFGAAIPGDRAFGELSLSAALKAEPGAINLRDAKFALGEMTGAGTLASRLSGERPSFSGKLAIDRFDLADFLSFAPQDSATGWSDAAFDLSGLTGFDADLSLKARSADIAGFAVQNLAVTLSAGAGRMWARVDSALAYAAILHGTVTVDLDGATPRLGFTLAAEGVDAQAALAAAFNGVGLTGRANIKLDLTAKGASRLALIDTLAGTTDIVLLDGALDGIDPAELARTAADEGGPHGLGAGAAVAFKRLSAAFDIQNGHARSSSIRLVSGAVRVDADGAFDLPARTLALRAFPIFTPDDAEGADAANAGRLAMPFALSGAWAEPRAEPDWAALMAALQVGRVSLEAIERLPEPKRAWFKGLIESGETPPWPSGIERAAAPADWQPW